MRLMQKLALVDAALNLRRSLLSMAAVTLAALCTMPVFAQDSDALAKAAQNPIASMISLPIQSNTNLNVGSGKGTQEVLNIQPVYPVSLNNDWNLITRTIIPFISQPELSSGQGRTNGLGDMQFSAFISPVAPTQSGWIWGAGAIAQLPTATSDVLGQGKWGAGPTAVALKIDGPWVYGALANNVWSFAGSDDRRSVNQLLIQPFVNYNVPGRPGFYITTSPIITADWKADSSQRWTVPIGLGVGQIMKWGTQPVNLQAAAYYNVDRPDGAANWNLRVQVQFLFPR